MAPLSFWTLRWIVVGLALAAQLYLFVRIWMAIRQRSGRWGVAALLACGVVIALLFAANWRIMSAPIPWVDPSPAVQAVFFYAPAVWSLGSIFSALLLLVAQAGGALVRLGARLLRGAGARRNPRPVDRGAQALPPGGRRGPRGRAVCHGRVRRRPASPRAAGRDPRVAVRLRSAGGSAQDIHAGVYMTTDTMSPLCRSGHRPRAGDPVSDRRLHLELDRLFSRVRRGDRPGRHPPRHLCDPGEP